MSHCFRSFIVSNPLSETTVYFESVYCNDTVTSDQQSIYKKSQQVTTEWGVEGVLEVEVEVEVEVERERDRERQRERAAAVD
jgi:hypothetical protein